MKQFLSVLVIFTMVFQISPMAFAGNGLIFLNKQTKSAPVNTGKGGGTQQIQVIQKTKGGQVVHPNNGQQNYQNAIGGKNNAVQAVAPSQFANYQNMYVMNSLQDYSKFMSKGQKNGFPVQTQNNQNNQFGQAQTGNNYPMSKEQWAYIMQQQKYQQQKEMMILQHQWQGESQNQQMQMMEQQRLRQEAIRREEVKQQQTMMAMQMFGGIFSMALMTHQQNKQARNERRFYQQETQRNRNYYKDLYKYRSRYNRRPRRYPRTRSNPQQWQYGQSNQYSQYNRR